MKTNSFKEAELLLIGVILSSACVLAFAPDAYLPMLARSFMLWWGIAFIAMALFALWRWQVRTSAAALVAACMTIPQMIVPSTPVVQVAGDHGLRIAHMNVLQPNEDHEQAIAAAVATGAEVISVQEVGPEWANALRTSLAASYPFHHVVPRTDCYGIALFSKLPFTSVRTITLAGTPFIEAHLSVDGDPVRLFAVHATSPGSVDHYRRRNAQLHALAEIVHASDTATFIIGDLNTVHWDNAYQRFCARSGMLPVNSSFTITWPSVGPLALIPLDHALVTAGIQPSALRSFNVSGSDHRGLYTELHFNNAH